MLLNKQCPRRLGKIIAGVPQGSILGHLLFNIFLNDLFSFLKDANLGNYADDSSLYAYNKNLEAVICNLSQEFSILSNGIMAIIWC